MNTSIKPQERINTALAVEPLSAHFPDFTRQFGERTIVLVRADMAHRSGAFKEYGVREAVAHLKHRDHTSVSTTSMGSQALAVASAGGEMAMRVNLSVTENIPPEKEARIWKIWEELGRDPQDLRIYKTGTDFDDAEMFGDLYFDPDTFIHPFNNPEVIRHRQKIFHDTTRAFPALRHLISPTGGGSLFAALTTAASETQVITYASEAEGSNSLSKSLRANEIVAADRPNPLYGGSAVRRVGETAFDLLRNVPGIAGRVVTGTDDIVHGLALEYALSTPRVPMEPTSLVAVAGLARIVERIPDNEPVAVIVTGHNETYRKILMAKKYQK